MPGPHATHEPALLCAEGSVLAEVA